MRNERKRARAPETSGNVQGRPRDLSSVATPSTLARPQRRLRKRGTLHEWYAWRRRKPGALHNPNIGEGGSTRTSLYGDMKTT
jgi:hypothetical protein